MVPFRTTVGRVEGTGRYENQVFTVFTEIRWTDIIPTVGHLMFFFAIPVINDDIIHLFFRLDVGDIPAILWPVERVDRSDTGTGDNFGFPIAYLSQIKGILFFTPKNGAGIGSPFQIEDIGFQIFRQHFFFSGKSISQPDIEFSVFVRDIGDPFSIRRPLRIAVVGIWGIGQIIGNTGFCR